MVQKEARPKEGRPRGRPKSFEPGEALNKARRAFWDGGYSATSLDDLADATGLKRPSLYGAFGDKRALYIQALDKSADESVAAITATFSPDLSVREGLSRVFAGSIAVYSAGDNGPRGCFIVGTALVESVTDGEIRDHLRDALDRIEEAFARRFRLAADRGELKPGADPAGLAIMTAGVLNTLAIRARAAYPREKLEAIASTALEMLAPA